MPLCGYCSRELESQDSSSQSYLTHLAGSHFDELGPIDRRRVESEWEGDLNDLDNQDHQFSSIQLAVGATVGSFILGLLVLGVLL